jgi:hypothetical protein
MRRIGLLLGLLLVQLLPSAADAQVLVPPPPVNQEGMREFCIYGNQLYSLGSQVCVASSNAGLRCVAGEAKSGGRAYWSYDSKEWPVSPGWRCGAGQ